MEGTPTDEKLRELAWEYLMGNAITYGAASFYDFLKEDNKGKKAYVCNGSACLVAGTQGIVTEKLTTQFEADEISYDHETQEVVEIVSRFIQCKPKAHPMKIGAKCEQDRRIQHHVLLHVRFV